MKAKYSLMASLCLKIKQNTNQSMGTYKPPIILFFFFLCSVFAAKAQEIEVHSTPVAKVEVKARIENGITSLKIGDKIPDELWNLPLAVINHPDGKETITLNDYRDTKLIVLDFWATYCKPCIQSLDQMDSIAPFFEEKELAVIPILAFDSKDRAGSFIEKKRPEWFSVVGDSVIRDVVLYDYLSGFGMAWIKDGRLLAVPSKVSQTLSNFEMIIDDQTPEIINRIHPRNSKP